jgi:ABC-type spermidine/putrescine transport systems, ATPase components
VAAELTAMNGAGRGASVSLTDLEKKFERVNAVDGVSLDIRSGEFLTLLGPSGSGKTTTLMMIAGFEMPSSGDIAIDGKSVVAMPPYRRNIGMVFQNYALFPHLTVEENIGFPLKQRGVAKAERVQAGRRGARAGASCRAMAAAIRASSRAASSSASLWPAPSSSSRGCC